MRWLLLIPLLAACTTAPKLNCDETCAMQEMVCVGQTMTNSKGMSVNAITLSSTRHRSNDESYQCAKDPAKADEIKAFRVKACERETAGLTPGFNKPDCSRGDWKSN